jgi:hypothetical protein
MFVCADGFEGWSGCPAENQYLPGERSASEPRVEWAEMRVGKEQPTQQDSVI